MTVDEQEEILTDRQMYDRKMQLLRKLEGYVKVVLWVSVILFVVSITSVIRSFQTQGSVDTLKMSTDKLRTETDAAKDAAIEARDALTQAIEDLESRRGSTPDSITNALLAIDRIERELCGGPCN